MDEYEKLMKKLLQTKFELDAGIYKRKSNKQILEDFNDQLEKMKKIEMNKNQYSIINNTCTTDCKVGKTQKSFNNDMKPITIKEMSLGTTYKNKYIKLEIYTELIIMTSIMFLGRDDNNDLTLIAIYNYENYFKTKNYKKLCNILKKGKYILVLEPFYKMFGSGEEGIRMEDPNEIILFDNKVLIDNFLFKKKNENIDFLYKEGNKSFENENYNKALAYFIKLKLFKPDDIEIDLKIAQCYFKFPYYTKTINKCHEILNKNINNVEAILLKIKSLIELRKVLEAKEFLNSKKKILENQKKKEFIEINEEIEGKIKNIKGKYNFADLYEKSKTLFNLNIGEFINKKLQINFEKNKGISIYTNSKIQKGELLVVSKAFTAAELNKNEKEIVVQYDNPSKEEFERTKQPLIYKKKEQIEEILSYKLSNFPEDYIDFLNLFDGNNIKLNLQKRKSNSEICLKKIQDVIQYNSLTISFKEKQISNGLWYYPSFFNHSCIPNCFYFGFGDILIIISICEIEPNKELFLNYLDNVMEYGKRQKYLKEKYNFICNCQLYEKNNIENKEKKCLDEYLNKIEINYNFQEIDIKSIFSKHEIEKMVDFIENKKKTFNCYEKSIFYIKCAQCMRKYDLNVSYLYLEKALRYCENRNYYFEKLTLLLMYFIAKQLKSEEKMNFSKNKLKLFWEIYFNDQKTFIETLIIEYLN